VLAAPRICRYYFGYKIASYKMANVEVSDARVLRMHEVLLAIKLVKFYVWERSFAHQVEEVGHVQHTLLQHPCLFSTTIATIRLHAASELASAMVPTPGKASNSSCARAGATPQ